MIPAHHTVKVRDPVIVKSSGVLVYALCSCPGSRPVEHTARYINSHKDLFELAAGSNLPRPEPLTAPPT